MRKAVHIVLVLVALSALIAGCTRASEEPQRAEPTPQPPAPAAGDPVAQGLNITFRSQPDPPQTGQNKVEVTVRGPDGAAITDAEVSVTFYMAAMPSMNMPEMRNAVPLIHASDGRYSGTANVMMAGGWDVTISVKREGQEIGSRQFMIMAK